MSFFLSPSFWKSIPAIVGMLFELKKLWDSRLEHPEDKHAKIKQLKDAIKAARESHDTTELSRIFNDLNSST